MKRASIEEDGENEWVLESLVGFLKGPLWTEPLFSFLDRKSVVFNPEDDGSNDGEYEAVYNEYKDFVCQLLDSHMKELGISGAQFECACEGAAGVLSRKFHQSLFEQIWAADDFCTFKRMMTQVNIDLQLWALEILAAKFGRVPNAFLPDGTDPQEFLSGDDFFLREAKRRSMIESDIEPLSRKLVRVKVAVEQRPDTHLTDDVGTGKDEQEKASNAQSIPQEQIVSDDPFAAQPMAMVTVSPVGVPDPERRVQFKDGEPTSTSKVWSIPARDVKDEGLDEEEIKHRQEYLRRQRDKLLGLKREEREKQAQRLERLERSGRRPQTAKFLAKEREDEMRNDEKKTTTRVYMRSLAARIKAEVLDADPQEESK